MVIMGVKIILGDFLNKLGRSVSKYNNNMPEHFHDEPCRGGFACNLFSPLAAVIDWCITKNIM